MRDFVYADDVIVEAYKVDGYYPFACVEHVAISMRSLLYPSSVPDSGAWEDYKYSGKNGWDVQLDGVFVLEDMVETLWFAWETLLLQLRTTGMDLRFRWTDKKGVEKHATGKALIPESGINGTSGDFGRWSLKLQGTGPLDVNGIVTPPVNPRRMRLEWIATGAEPNKVQNNALIGKTKAQVTHVSWEGNDVFQVIDEGNPTAKQVRLDNAEGSLRFANDFEADDYIWAIVEED